MGRLWHGTTYRKVCTVLPRYGGTYDALHHRMHTRTRLGRSPDVHADPDLGGLARVAEGLRVYITGRGSEVVQATPVGPRQRFRLTSVQPSPKLMFSVGNPRFLWILRFAIVIVGIISFTLTFNFTFTFTSTTMRLFIWPECESCFLCIVLGLCCCRYSTLC